MWTEPQGPYEELSEIGQRRREVMLDELQTELARLRVGRRRRRAAAHAALAVLIAGVTVAAWSAMNRRPHTPAPDRVALPANPEPAPETVELEHEAATNPVRIELVSTDPTTTGRLSTNSSRGSLILRIDDRELIETLAEINRPAGLVRMRDRAWVTADITGVDRELEEGSDARSNFYWRRWMDLISVLG